MKRIKINVTTKYTVGLGVNVPDDVYEGLCKAYNNGGEIDPDSIKVHTDKKLSAASDWLADNIREKDAMNWEWEIYDIEESNQK